MVLLDRLGERLDPGAGLLDGILGDLAVELNVFQGRAGHGFAQFQQFLLLHRVILLQHRQLKLKPLDLRDHRHGEPPGDILPTGRSLLYLDGSLGVIAPLMWRIAVGPKVAGMDLLGQDFKLAV